MLGYSHFPTIAFLLSALVASSNAASIDRKIAQVETGLLPIATAQLGAKATIKDRLRGYGIPGMSVAVIEGGKIAWAKGYGVADIKTGRRVTPTTIFQAASISKPISAMGVLHLVQEGRLSLDDDISDKLKTWRPHRDRILTARMLLNHTSGLNVPGFAGYAAGAPLPTLIEILAGSPPANSPAIQVETNQGVENYSGGGYEVLQQLIIDISGQPFIRYMQSAVLKPLGMNHSTFEQPLSKERVLNAAMGYHAGGRPIAGGFKIMPELAAAGLWSTPSDIARYVLNVQESGGGHGEVPVGSALIREMLSGNSGGHGLGPTISGVGSAVRFGHDGFNEGYESTFVGYVHGGHGAVVMANSSFAFMLIEEVIDSIRRAYSWPDFDVTSQRPPDDPLSQQLVVPFSLRKIAAIVGDYALEDGSTIKIQSAGRRVFIDWPGDGKAEVFATADHRLFCPQLTFSEFGSPWLRFVDDEPGKSSLVVGPTDDSTKVMKVR